MALTVPLERISERSRRVDVRKGLLALLRLLATLLVGFPYVLGWLVGKLWLGLTVAWVAAGEGWRDARARPSSGGRSRIR
ncbi:hypothetical protein ACQP2T_63355 (plasmid) [Nonomuraea sp. CA-143628]|uniref:hypothetical protein n=1 Tax=Nonomuraea sp. CA-143628 TaxID=3239997 RepID=UPI003D916C5A